MGWLVLAYSLATVPLAFWWCCCRAGNCSLNCCRSNTAPNSSSAGIAGYEFKFTNFPTNTALGFPAGECEAFYNGVSIILDYQGGVPGGDGECAWRGLGEILGRGFELPMVRVFPSCSSDRKTFTMQVGAGTYGGGFSGNSSGGTNVTITSATAGDVECNAIASGTLSSIFPAVNECVYNGATFTIQAIPA